MKKLKKINRIVGFIGTFHNKYQRLPPRTDVLIHPLKDKHLIRFIQVMEVNFPSALGAIIDREFETDAGDYDGGDHRPTPLEPDTLHPHVPIEVEYAKQYQ